MRIIFCPKRRITILDNLLMKFIDLSIGQHISALGRDPNDGDAGIVASEKIKHVVDDFSLFAPILGTVFEDFLNKMRN